MLVIALFLNACAFWFVVGAVRSMLRARRQQAERRDGELVVSSMAGLTMAAMFLGLKAIVQPEARHAIVEIVEERSIDDDSGGEPPGGHAFHEALRRIRQGEEVDSVTFRVDTGPQEETTAN